MTTNNSPILVDDGPKIGQGDIPITLGDKEYVLKPTVHAVTSLSRQFGGLSNAIRAVQDLNFEAVISVIIAGIGNRYTNPKLRAELSQMVYEAGLSDDTGQIIKQVGRFLLVLLRGGRPVPENIEDIVGPGEQQQAAEGEGTEGNPPSSN